MYNNKVKVVRLIARYKKTGAFSHNIRLVIKNDLSCNVQQLTKALAEREFGQWQKASIRLSCAKYTDIRQGDIVTYKGNKQEYEVLDCVHRATHTLATLGLYGGMIARKLLHGLILRDNAKLLLRDSKGICLRVLPSIQKVALLRDNSGFALRDVDNKVLKVGGENNWTS